MTTTPLAGFAGTPSQHLEVQIAALRALGDDEFADVDGFGLRPILVPVRTVFSSIQALSSRVQQ